MPTINWLAVLAATAANFLLGGVWYGALGPSWLEASPAPITIGASRRTASDAEPVVMDQDAAPGMAVVAQPAIPGPRPAQQQTVIADDAAIVEKCARINLDQPFELDAETAVRCRE